MAEEIYAGDAIIYNDEERREAGERWRQEYGGGGNYTPPSQGGSGEEGGYYDGQMPAVDQPAEPSYQPEQQMQPEQPVEVAPEPQPSNLWLADPVNFTAIEDKYKDPNYEDEHWSRDQIETLGAEFAYRNQGKPRDQWEPLYDDNEFVVKEMSKWYDPVKEQEQQEAQSKQGIEQYYSPQNDTERAMFEERETRSWDDLKWWQKGLYAFFPGQADEGLGDAPDWTQKSRDFATALQSAGAGAAFLKIVGTGAGMLGATGAAAVLTNPFVLAAAAVGMGGLLYYQSRTGKELPVINKIAEFTDLPDTITEHAIGTGIQAGRIASGYLQKANADPNDAYGFMGAINDTLKEVIQYRNDIWNASEYTYEMYGGVGDILVDAANVLFEGDLNGTKLGEAWMFNKGYSEKVQLAEGTYGGEGLENFRKLITNMREQGLSDDVINSLVQSGVINVGGFSSVMSDNIGQMVFDLSMFAPGAENAIADTVSRATGWETGIKAAERNRATSVISDLPVIGAVYNGLTGSKSSGGINEFTEQAKILIRSKDVSELSTLDRIIGGLDDQGRIKQLLPTEKQGLMDWLPETKVLGSDNVAMNVINSQMSEAQTDTEVEAVLDNYVNGTEGIYNSPDVVSTRDAVAAGRKRADVYFQRYRDGEQGRVYLKTVAEALGMEQKDIITMVEEKPEVLTKRLQDYAAKHEGKIGTIDAASIDNTVTVLKGFTGKNALLWNINQLKAATTGAVFDGMNEYNIKKYGVKPDHFMVQMADTIKAGQSLMLLGLSPSYLINNVINNTVTSIAEGVFGLMTPKQMQAIFDEMGIVPARLGETLSEFRGMDGSMSSLDAMNQKISEAKRTQGLLSDIRSTIRKVNSKAGVFSNISGKFEELQGKQVTATAINQYWRQTWKAGVGFQAMPEALVNRIEAQNPGMTNMIYLAVERGMNMQSITKALYGEYIHADISAVLKDVIAESFPGEASVYDELFVKSNLINEIEAAFSMCNTEEERAAALKRIRENTRQFINNLKRNELIDKAESIKNLTDAEGVNAAQNILGEMAINRAQTWLLTRDEWNDLYKKIAAEKYKGPERASLISALNMKQRAAWEAQYAYELQVLKGIMDGLGFETETNAQYIDTTIQMNHSWQDFYKEKDRLAKETQLRIQQRIDRMSKAEIESGAIMLVVNEEWNTYYDETEALYKEYFRKEQDFQRQLDETFVKGYEKATGKSGEQIAQNLANIRDIRQQMATMQQEAHNRTRNMTDADKAKFYAEFDPKYNALIIEIEKLQKATGTLIDAEEGKGYTDNDPVNMTAEQTVRANETVEAANAERERARKERIGFMSRDEIRTGWIQAGISERYADLMMVLYDKAAEAWAKQEGKSKDDFYTEALELRDLLRWAGIDDTNVLNQDDHKRKQMDIINESNPMRDDYHVGIRSVEDVLTFTEAVEADRKSGEINVYPDWKEKDIRNAIETGHITIYSSKPIENGVFVTPSEMMARDYAGGKNAKIYTKTVDLYSVAWINSSEGEYAHVSRFDSEYINQSKEAYYTKRIMEHWVLQTFKDWFDGSVVHGEDGYPIVVHHGTPFDFDRFDKSLLGTESNMREARMGFFFSENEANTKQYKNRKAKDVFRNLISYDSGLELTDIDISKTEKIISEYQKWQDIINHSNLKTYFENEPGYFTPSEEFVTKIRSLQESGNDKELRKTLLIMSDATERFVSAYIGLEDVMSAEGRDVAVYLQIKRPLEIEDFQAQDRIIPDIVKEAKDHPELYDGVIIRNIPTNNGGDTYYVVFEPTQIKGIENDGTFDSASPNYLKQKASEAAKGTFEHTDMGNIIRMLQASDVSTMVHESGHLFRRTLNEQNMREFTQWAGFKDVTEFQTLEARYWANDPTLTDADRKRYVDAEEKFARGFEQYMIDGSAPTLGLKKVFKEFSRFLLSIYKNIKDLGTKDYSGQGEFVFDGEVLNINAEINGIKLRDIFDRMLADGEIDRTPGYAEAVQQQVSDMKMTRARMKPETQQRRAQLDINRRVLSNWNSLAEAEAFLWQMKQPIEIDGLTVDDTFLDDVIHSAKTDPKMNPFGKPEVYSISGTLTYAASNTDPNRRYQFAYKVMELDDLIPSHVQMGDDLIVNEAYPTELNPRAMDSQQDRNRVYTIAANLNGRQMTTEQNAIDTGVPIVGGEDPFVESGNARVLALQQARQEMPENWQRYQNALRQNVGKLGINPNDLDSFDSPVLVRERLNGYAGEFTADANSPRANGDYGMNIPMVLDDPEIEAPEFMEDSSLPPLISNQETPVPNAMLNQSVQETVPDANYAAQETVASISETASNTRKANLQQTFDEGMAIPFDKIDDIQLSGADDMLYGRLMQAKIDEISKAQGYTDAQSEYASEYLNWKLNDERGDEPHAATPLIEDRVRKDIDNVIEQGGVDLNVLRDLKRPGKEVDDTPVPSKGIYVKQVYAFQHGDYMIAANVYVDGEFYGYLPEDLSRMERTVKGDDGVIYKTLAIDPDDPRGLVYDDAMAEEIRTVIPGKVEGIEGPQEPKEFMRPARQGTTPEAMPMGSSYEEVFNKYLDPIMDKFGAAFESAETDARTKNFGGLDLETRALIEKWLDNNVKQDMAENKYRAVKYSDMKKDAAMLNYNERYGFDPILTILSPYQFWYTRSMWQWAKRMIDKPRWNQMYSRMKDLEEENRQEIMPSRLEGKFRIPMPWLPEWMGGGYYVDLNSQLFPFSQFGESYGNNMSQAVVNAKTESILNEQYESQLISYEQMQEALSKKSGTVWENAYAQAEQEASSDQMKDTLISQFYSPSIFVSWFNKKRAGEDPGMLSSTRTGNAIKTLTSGTGLEGIGGAIGDAMTLPEQALRKLYGFEYNEFGAYGDQQIRKQISQMCADGEITWRQALNAMVEKSGTIWDMAADRQRHENEMRVPGFAGAEAIKSFTQGQANFGDVIGALGASMLGGQFFPTGERELREMKAAKDQAYIDKASGKNPDAVNQWYDATPEYLTRQATYIDDPEELLKFTLYNNITNIYYAQPYAQQQGIKNQLGPEFAAAILNNETRNYKAVPIQKLAEWNARIGGSTPNVGSIDVEGVERVMQYSEPVIDSVDQYYAERDQLFPGISVIQNGYNAIPKDQRKAYIGYFPMLKEYWDWNRAYKDQHPEFTFWNEQRSGYYNEETCWNSYADMSEFTQKALDYAKMTKGSLNDTARYELMNLYRKYANQNFMSFESYVKLLQNWN